ncbi:MAG: SHOCT domain-containing protein [Pseudomonadota bacterium]
MMKYTLIKLYIVGLILTLGAGYTTGCASKKSFDYTPVSDEMMSGPGLISGQQGDITVFRIPDKPKGKTDESPAVATSLSKKLVGLKEALDKGLISEIEYKEKRKKILDEY